MHAEDDCGSKQSLHVSSHRHIWQDLGKRGVDIVTEVLSRESSFLS
jgi:hypothetical protein